VSDMTLGLTVGFGAGMLLTALMFLLGACP
jgi:hypothetical protein